MFQYSIPQWLFIFYIYCFFGWCFESAYVSICNRRLVNRGFMRGPFLPLYGSGAVMMLVVSAPFGHMDFPWNLVLTYLGGCIGATVLEYVTGVTMESLFKIRYWDYSDKPCNFQGHICLGSTLAWGFLTVLMTFWVHRPIENMVLAIPGAVLSAVTFVLTAGVGADFALSFKAALDLRDVLAGLEKIRVETAHMQKRVDIIIALTNEELGKRKEELLENLEGREEKFARLKKLAQTRPETYRDGMREELSELRERYRIYRADKERLQGLRDFFQRDMVRSNPSMVSPRFGESLRELQEKLEQEWNVRRRRK